MRVTIRYEDGPLLGKVSFDDEANEDNLTEPQVAAAQHYRELHQGELTGQFTIVGHEGRPVWTYAPIRRIVNDDGITLLLGRPEWDK